MPHGGQKSRISPPLPPIIKMRTKRRFPSERAVAKALRSAQSVAPKELFSAFVPVKMLPSAHSSAVATQKFE